MNSKKKDCADTRRILVVSGPSGVGKTTLCDYLARKEKKLAICVTATTREPRSGEKDGRDYHFIAKAEFRKGIKENKFVEYTHLFGNYYGTPVSSLERIFARGKYPLLRVDVDGARSLKKLGYKGVYIFILPPDSQTLKERLTRRSGSETKTEIVRRLKRAETEIGRYQDYDFRIINDKIPETLKKIQQIIKKHLYCKKEDNQ